MSVLEHRVLVIDIGRDGPVVNAYDQLVGSVSPSSERQLEVRELDGTIALTVEKRAELPRGSHQPWGHPVVAGSGQPIGFATESIGLSCADEPVLLQLGPAPRPHGEWLGPSSVGGELARVDRLGRSPGQSSNLITRFHSDRLRFEFITEAADLRSLAIAVAYIGHLSRFDD